MTTTMTETFRFERNGKTYSGDPLWDVYTPAGSHLGRVAKSHGSRGSTWLAHADGFQTMRGFRGREDAARRLLEIAEGEQ